MVEAARQRLEDLKAELALIERSIADLSLVAEGGGAVALSALTSRLWTDEGLPPGPIVVVVSGGNVDPTLLAEVLAGAD